MLLHHMEVNDWTVMVVHKEDDIRRRLTMCKGLGLNISPERFFGLTRISKIPDRFKILVDDADHICRMHPDLGYTVIGKAHVITVTK